MRPELTTGALLKRLAVPAFFVGLLFIAVFRRAPEPPLPDAVEAAAETSQLELQGETMGTTFTVKAVGTDIDEDVLTEAVSTTLAEVDALMSNWRDDSEISRFNASGTEPFELSPPTAEVLALAKQVYTQTGGAFDVTVGPLVESWGFGPDGAKPAPTDEELAALQEHVGFELLTLEGSTLAKADPRVRVDLAAIAKGDGVDRVAEAVHAVDGVESVMVEIGGEVRVMGTNAQGVPWRLAVERPDAERRDIHSVVGLDSGALATSGDYRRFIDEAGNRRTHVVDPRTGRPVEHGVASASVLGPDCATADAWATALMVLDPDEGKALVESIDGLEAMIIVRSGEEMQVEMTPGFRAALVQPTPSAG